MTEIKQIAVTGDNYNSQLGIFGLGDDSNVYVWEHSTGTWELFKSSGETELPPF